MRKLSKTKSVSTSKHHKITFFFEGSLKDEESLQKAKDSSIYNKSKLRHWKNDQSKHRSLTSLNSASIQQKPRSSYFRLKEKPSIGSQQKSMDKSKKQKQEKPIFISKVKEKFYLQGDKAEKLSKKVKREDINFTKVDYVALYSNNCQLKMGQVVEGNETSVHDYSEQFIISKGTIKLKNSAKSLYSSDEEDSDLSPSSKSSANQHAILNRLQEIKHYELLSLTKKKSKESEFLLFLGVRKMQCLIGALHENYPFLAYHTVLGPIKIDDDPNKVSEKSSHTATAAAKNANLPVSILKKNKKKVKLHFTINNQVLYFAFPIKRRDRLDKRRSVHYKQKMLIACESCSEQEFRKYLGRYIKECLYIKSTPYGKKIVSREDDIPIHERTSITQKYKGEIDENLDIHTNNSKTLHQSLTVKRILNKIAFISFIQIKNKHFLCGLQKEKINNHTVISLLYEVNKSASLPKFYQFVYQMQKSCPLFQQLFRKLSIKKTLHEISPVLGSWIRKVFAKQVFGFKDDDLGEDINFKMLQFSEFKENNNKKLKVDIVELPQSFFTVFTYQIEENFQKGTIFRKYNMSIGELNFCRKKRRKGTQAKELPKAMKKFLFEAIFNEEFMKLKNNEETCESKLDKKSYTKIEEFIKKSRKNKNFFKIRNSFDYGVRKGSRFFVKSYENNYYQINSSDLTVKGFKSGARIQFSIEKQEEKEQLLILNLPYHLDPILSLKWEDYVLSKIIERNKNNSYKFCVRTGSKFLSFQSLQNFLNAIPNSLKFRIHCPISKRVDFFTFSDQSHSWSEQYLKESAKKLQKYKSTTYSRFSLEQLPYQILYKKIHKLSGGIYIIFTYISIPLMKFSYLKMYNRKDQTSFIVQISELNKSNIAQLVSQCQKVLIRQQFDGEIHKIKKRIERKNREMYEKLLSLSSFKETKKCLVDNNNARRKQRNFKQNTKFQISGIRKILPNLSITREFYSKFYTTSSKRTFFILILKIRQENKNQNKVSKQKIKIMILQAGKILIYDYVLDVDFFLERMSINLSSKATEISNTHKNQHIREFILPILSILQANYYARQEVFFKEFSLLFETREKSYFKEQHQNRISKSFFLQRYLCRSKLLLVVQPSGQEGVENQSSTILYDPSSKTKKSICEGCGSLMESKLLAYNKSLNSKLMKRILKNF